MKYFLCVLLFSLNCFSVQKGTVNVPEADIYKDDNFDADIIENVKQGETFLISNKTYGPFYKIKLKSGKIGFIPDHEVDIKGKPFVETPFDEDGSEIVKTNKKKNSKAKVEEKEKDEEEDDDEDESFDSNYKGVSFQLINFHEDTMGGIQVENLYAIGYKAITPSFMWEVFASQAPKYYAEKSGGSASGFNIWASTGFNASIPITSLTALRYGGSIMGHFSEVKVNAPAKSYDLQELTAGIVLEGGYLLQLGKVTLDFSVKYFFDRNNYGGLGLSLLF